MAVGVAHAEGLVDGGGARIGDFRSELIELRVVGVHQRADVAEGQQVVLGLEPEDVEHRLRPEDAATRQVPVPQAAAAAVERRVDAAAYGLVDGVGLARTGRLPVEGEAEDEHDEAGGGGEGDGERRQRTPGRQRGAARLDDGEIAEWRMKVAHGGEHLALVGQGDLQHAGGDAEGGERLAGAEHVDQPAADEPVGIGFRGGDDAVLVGEQKAAAVIGGPGRKRVGETVARLLGRAAAGRGGRLQALGGEVGDRAEREHLPVQRLVTVLAQLHRGADADGGKKADDENGDRAAEQGLRSQQPPVSRFGDRLREALDRIGSCRRTRHVGARHGRPPLGFP